MYKIFACLAKYTLISLCILLPYFGFSQTKPVWHWANSAANLVGSSNQFIGYGIDADQKGNVYCIGGFQGTASFGGINLSSAGDEDMFIVKYDSCGTAIWAKRAGGKFQDRGYALEIDSQGNIIVSGYFITEADFDNIKFNTDTFSSFIAKYSPNGEVIWVKDFSGINFSYSDNTLTFDKESNIYACGYFFNNISIHNQQISPNGQSDVFLLKLDKEGNFKWIRAGGGFKFDFSFALVTDQDLNVYMAGFFTQEATFGSINLTAPLRSTFLIKYDKDGSLVWAKKVPDELVNLGNSNSGYSLVIDQTDNLYLAGSIEQITEQANSATYSFLGSYLIAYDKLGNIKWTKKNRRAGISNLALDALGNLYTTGGSGNPGFLDSDNLTINEGLVYVSKYQPDGKLEWIKTDSNGNNMSINAMSVSPDGKNIYLDGFFFNTIRLDNVELRGINDFNFFVIKLKQIEKPDLAGTDKEVCVNSPIQLGINPRQSTAYEWTPATGLSNANIAQPIFKWTNSLNNPDTLTYILKVTETYCTKNFAIWYDTVKVSVYPNYDSIKVKSGSTTVCPLVGGIKYWVNKKAGFQYEWQVSGGTIENGQGSDTIRVTWGIGPNVKAWVKIRAFNPSGCESFDTLQIKVDDVLKPDKPHGSTLICLKPTQSYIYQTSLRNNKSIYEWLTDDPSAVFLSKRDSSQIEVKWLTVGEKKIWVKETSQTPCVGFSEFLTVNVYPNPIPFTKLNGPSPVPEFTSQVPYFVESRVNSRYQWVLDSNGGEIVEGQGNASIKINWSRAGIYTLSVQEISQFDCVGETQTFQVEVVPIKIYNVITPNDIDNKNQFWVLDFIEYFPNHKIEIYNRLGDRVYSSKNYQNNWQAEGLPAGIYYYQLFLHPNLPVYKGWLEVKKDR
jgi:gliding motility-associated-like protein